MDATLPEDPSLLDEWTDLLAHVERVCQRGVDRFFAPWHAPTVDEYSRSLGALALALRTMKSRGGILPGRALALTAAAAAHAAPYARDATLDALGERDRALRSAFTAPIALRALARERVPEGPWPLPQFIPPSPEPGAWRRAR